MRGGKDEMGKVRTPAHSDTESIFNQSKPGQQGGFSLECSPVMCSYSMFKPSHVWGFCAANSPKEEPLQHGACVLCYKQMTGL